MPLLPPAHREPDRPMPARWLLPAAAAVTALAIGATVLVVSIQERAGNRKCAALIRALHLSAPALVPSGRRLRNPETAVPAVDWRFAPQLPFMAAGTEGWLLSIPNAEP